jgi:ABC-type cobalt transport system substrate-binding protein
MTKLLIFTGMILLGTNIICYLWGYSAGRRDTNREDEWE